MVWVWVIVAAAVGGLVMVVAFAVTLWRKTLVLLRELGTLGDQLGDLADIVGGIGADTVPTPVRADSDALIAT